MKLNEQLSRIKEVMGINEAPQPIIVYHGSTKEITNFVDDFVGGEDATDQEGPGIYFTTSKQDAQLYGEHIHEVTLSPRKLLTKNSKGGSVMELTWLCKKAPEWKDTAQNWHENPYIGVTKAVEDFIEYNDNQKDRFLQVWYDFYRYQPLEYVRNCVELGYDGIVVDKEFMIEGNPIKHYIIYNPNIIQIKQKTQD